MVHSYTLGGYQETAPKASVLFCGAGVFQCFGSCFSVFLCFVYVFCGDPDCPGNIILEISGGVLIVCVNLRLDLLIDFMSIISTAFEI